jgi:hypothetical protein
LMVNCRIIDQPEPANQYKAIRRHTGNAGSSSFAPLM